MVKNSFDIAIIGGGIVGAACAYRLSAEGLNVALIEEKTLASGTTASGMGHIVVMDDSEEQFALTDYSQKLWRDLAVELPKDSEFQTCGTIWVAADDDEMAEVERKRNFYAQRNVKAEILDEKSLREAEPNLRNGLVGGLLVPNDAVVYQLCATKYFAQKAQEKNAQIILGQRVSEILNDGVKLANGDIIKAKNIIVASGIGSANLIKSLPMRRKKGHLVITERYPNFVKHQLVELGYLKSAHSSESDSVAFNVQPRATEQVLIGSSRQFDIEDKAIDYNLLQQMLQRAFAYMPKLKDLMTLRIWTGFRPATPDNLPYIGRYEKLENVFLATGHEGLGITTSLGTAEILTDEILGRESKIDRTVYSPNRII